MISEKVSVVVTWKKEIVAHMSSPEWWLQKGLVIAHEVVHLFGRACCVCDLFYTVLVLKANNITY